VSRYEGDLVAKFYFAKHKLVWEVLDGGLKSKIEVQWSDIAAIKVSFTEDGPDTLDIVVSFQCLLHFSSACVFFSFALIQMVVVTSNFLYFGVDFFPTF
jgi:hypothetical protein